MNAPSPEQWFRGWLFFVPGEPTGACDPYRERGRAESRVRSSVKSSRRLRHGSIRIRMVRRCAGRVSSYRLTSLPPDRCTRLRPRCSGLSASSLRTVFPSNCRNGGSFLTVGIFAGRCSTGMVVAEQIGGLEIVYLVVPLLQIISASFVTLLRYQLPSGIGEDVLVVAVAGRSQGFSAYWKKRSKSEVMGGADWKERIIPRCVPEADRER